MTIRTEIIATSMVTAKTKENVSIVCVSRDNRSLCINLASSEVIREDGHLPCSITLSEKPLPNFRIISRIASDNVFSKEMFSTNCRVIANSIEDKLKSYVIIKELTNCI